jgi:hypothetical protein
VRIAVLPLALLFAAALAGGCSLLHDDYPDKTCEGNSDCFRAQGEYCERDAGVCRVAPDGGAPGAAGEEAESVIDEMPDQPAAAATPAAGQAVER